MTEFVVVRTHPDMLSYVDKLQRENAEQLAFYPRCVFEREHESGRLYLGLLNGQPAGYIYRGAGPAVRCHQVCIEYDARRRRYGAGLVTVLEHDAITERATAITLRCGADLDANAFWRDLGYTCVATHPGGIRRNRTINVWRKSLAPELFADIAIEPARHGTSATQWASSKQTGLVTQFHRGRALRDYRAIILDEKP